MTCIRRTYTSYLLNRRIPERHNTGRCCHTFGKFLKVMALSPTFDDADGHPPTDADKPDEHSSSNLQENNKHFLGRCISHQGPRQASETIPWRTLRRACPIKNGPSYRGYKLYRVMYITFCIAMLCGLSCECIAM